MIWINSCKTIMSHELSQIKTFWDWIESNKKMSRTHVWSGQGQVKAGHGRSPESKILFRACGTWFIVTIPRRIQKSKPLCNLTLCKSTIEKGQVNPVTHKVKFSNWYFRMKKCVFLNHFDFRIPKMLFYVCAMSRNAQNRSSKNDVINGYGYWTICLPKMNVSNWNLACRISRHSSTTYIPVFIYKKNILY